MYLLFSPNDLLPLDKIVLNTEAHPFPRFDTGQLLYTGWKRKPHDKQEQAKDEQAKGEQSERRARQGRTWG
jgi:mannosyl-oligosaccharide alpha-1,2-mannosidase